MIKQHSLAALAASLAIFALAPVAWSQPATPSPVQLVNEAAAAKDVFTFDYAVPGSPALSLLGIDASKVTQSNSLKPFVLSLPSVLGGSEQGQSIALDIAPGWLLDPGLRTYDKYVNDRTRRLMLRTHTGIALYEGSEDSANPAKSVSSRLAGGVSISLLDSSDPLMAKLPGHEGGKTAWQDCLDRSGPAVQAVLDAAIKTENRLTVEQRNAYETEQMTLIPRRRDLIMRRDAANAGRNTAEARRLQEQLAPVETRLKEVGDVLDKETADARAALTKTYAASKASTEVAKCAKEADLAARVSRDLDFGIGAIWRGNPGELSSFDPAGGALWLSYRHPLLGLKKDEVIDPTNADSMKRLNTWWMVGGSLRASFDEYVATGVAATPEIRADTVDAWVGVENNSVSRRFSLQIGYQERDPEASAPASFDRSRTRALASWAQRLGDEESSAWLNVSYGDAQGHGSYKDDDMLLISIIFAPPDPKKIFGS